ncbi:MAG: M3 family metallopeptidase [Kiritimatiellia bacterium]
MKDLFPDWAAFTPESAAAELPRLLADAEKAVSALEAAEPATYEDFVWRLDDATRWLWRCWGGVAHMLGVMNDAAWRRLEEEWQPRLVAFSLRVGQSRRLYDLARACRAALDAGPAPADLPARRRILQQMIQGAELAGVGLDGERKARFNAIQSRLARLGADFHNAVIDATGAFRLEKDGQTYTLDDAAYPETMKHCADRAVREALYRARVARAPENAARIDEILQLRHEAANLLGFANYAEKSLAVKCAPSVAAVLRMLDDLDAATAAKAAAERLDVEPWDVAYAAERLRERQYAYSEEELKRYFELEDVLKGLFRLTSFLFDVEIEEVAARPPVWHEDVRFFAVKERGETIAHFYFDPFVRPGRKSGGAWMNDFRNRSRRGPDGAVTLPLAVIVTNFPAKDAAGQCLLPLREVETLFHEFGHALQCMLTRVDEEDAAGTSLVEWDAVEVASQFMENWCLDDRTGIRVPSELKAKVRAARNFRAASACRRQLAFAQTDLLLHTRPPGDPDALRREIFAHFGLPSIPGDRFLCSFTHIFAGGYAAGYYGYKWAEVMSADCYGAFEEAGLADDAALRRLGQRYRETVLALGGSQSALAVFRAFRGRDPEIQAMIRQQDLV